MIQFSWRNCVTLSLIILCSACHREQEISEAKQIFLDQQRSMIEPRRVPFIISVNHGCTGFIIDTEKKLAISAQHCGVTKAANLCFLQSRLYSDDWQRSQCQHEGRVEEIIESSPVAELDYVIFHYEFTTTEPTGLQSVRLAKTDFLQTLYQHKRALTMIGYPADAYQKTFLTSSKCVVREPKIRSLSGDTTPESMAAIDAIIKAWEADKRYSKREDYAAMREECFFIAPSGLKSRPTFKEDCSVYGGNSGGPILIDESRTVIGMPASYYPQPDPETQQRPKVDNSCYDKYWDTYFQPYWGQRPVPSAEERAIEIAQAKIWDQLDRQSEDLSHFPTAIPMHLIVASSQFLQKNLQYLVDKLQFD